MGGGERVLQKPSLGEEWAKRFFFLNLLLNHPFRVHMLNPLSMYFDS